MAIQGHASSRIRGQWKGEEGLPYLTYLTFGVGAQGTPALRTEASIWAQCAIPTDLMVEEIS